ncbi:MAG: amidase [Alphaproteobacteria bacterium]|nr:amidase [Alphaproteobacteria bacterium]
METIAQLQNALADRRTTSRTLVDAALARIDDPAGEGERVFIRVFHDRARAEADASDARRRAGSVPSPLAGIPVSVKDLCDIAGYTTLAGSIVLKDHPPATADAPVIRRLRAAGAIILGTTNMVEFAFGSHGRNPHYGTPKNPWDRATGRIPGGSSSGAAVAVADRMGAVALGTDTGGSVRMPAAFCGVVGLKTTIARVPRDGLVPLSYTLDSVGPLAPSVDCAAVLDQVMAGEPPAPLPALPVAGLRFAVPKTTVRDGLDDHVATCFERTLARLSAAGVRIVETMFPALDEVHTVNRMGTMSTAEGWHWHRALIEKAGDKYDPSVIARFRRGAGLTAADHIEIMHRRLRLMAAANAETAPFDAVVMPTVPAVAPPIAAFDKALDQWPANHETYRRNTSIGNFIDRPGLTIPCQDRGTGPVGFMLMGETGGDRRLLAIGRAVEAIVRGAA